MKMFIGGLIIAMIRSRRCQVRSVYSRTGCAFIVSEKFILYNKKLLVDAYANDRDRIKRGRGKDEFYSFTCTYRI